MFFPARPSELSKPTGIAAAFADILVRMQQVGVLQDGTKIDYGFGAKVEVAPIRAAGAYQRQEVD